MLKVLIKTNLTICHFHLTNYRMVLSKIAIYYFLCEFDDYKYSISCIKKTFVSLTFILHTFMVLDFSLGFLVCKMGILIIPIDQFDMRLGMQVACSSVFPAAGAHK